MGNSHFKKISTKRDQRDLTWSRAGWGSCCHSGKLAGGRHSGDGGPHPRGGGLYPRGDQGGASRARNRGEEPVLCAGAAAGAVLGGHGPPLPMTPGLPASPWAGAAGQGPRAPSQACQQNPLWLWEA